LDNIQVVHQEEPKYRCRAGGLAGMRRAAAALTVGRGEGYAHLILKVGTSPVGNNQVCPTATIFLYRSFNQPSICQKELFIHKLGEPRDQCCE
jgi:hypothetical protein